MTELTDLQQAITVLETQRGVLGDAVVDASVAALRRQLADLDAAPPDEQRKLVTVLFADLAGWTALSERMDPEDVRELQDAYFAAVTKPIDDYGGSVEKYIGDAVLAVFGVPETHEDDAERARFTLRWRCRERWTISTSVGRARMRRHHPCDCASAFTPGWWSAAWMQTATSWSPVIRST